MVYTIDKLKVFADKLIDPTRFTAKIFVPALVGTSDASNLSEIMIETTAIPGRSIGKIELPTWGGDVLPLSGHPTYNDWNCTIVSDGSMDLYKTFERWMEIMHSTIAGTSAPGLAYMGVIELALQNSLKTNIYTKELVNAFPIDLGEFAVSKTSRDDVVRFDVTFAYSFPVGDLT